MNSPSQITPQGSSPEQKQQGRKRFYLAFFTIVSLNAIFLVLALFIQGCKRQPAAEQPADPGAVVNADSNSVPVTDIASATNPPVQASNVVQQIVEPTPVPPLPPAASPTEHTIVKGDMLGDIAKKYGVTLKALKAANPTVDEKHLQIGKKLVIPAPASAEVHSPPPGTLLAIPDSGEQMHVVKSGDTLGALAKKYGTSIQAIQEANALKDTRIIVGQKLKIPAKASAPSPVVEPAPVAPTVAPATAPR
ncbi:MAG: LysM peptidoglycan-binding domain-containing protein [Verrucomicrobia bacterium]|nr:LysM peptidoglycan-binding domain-containing protein [Verrucomicrobiota bacterium]